ncbi:MAG: 16S rRNA (cytidine(1402)-2'-O)-methyltransferase, partial [Bacteroidetes bacterium]
FILYESPHRLVKCLEQLIEHCGADRQACVARELTKIHEDIRTTTLQQLADYYRAQDKVRGEIVLVVGGK